MLVDSLVKANSKKTEAKNKLYIQSYGCQMNFADSEVVASILEDEGYTTTTDPQKPISF